MLGAALSLWERCSTLVRSSRWLAAFSALGLATACSVYTSELVEETTGITTAGTSSLGGKASSTGGKPSGTGGKTGIEPSGGDAGEDPDTAGMSGGGKSGEAAGGTGTGSAGTGVTAPMGGSAGAGGSAPGIGGSAGTGGSGTTGEGDLVDGFEDDDLTLEQVDGRGGVWYLVGDGTTGTVGPTPLVCTPNSGAPVALGGYAMHITATGFTGSGSLLGADLRNLKKVYNGTKFTGLRFWAKVGAGKNTKHRVQLSDATTDRAAGNCDPESAVAAEMCDDHFGVNMTFTTTWTQYSIAFKDMAQVGWGKPAAALNKAALYGVQVTAKPKLSVDLWLDQIEFY